MHEDDESLVCSTLTMLLTLFLFALALLLIQKKENQNKCYGVGGISLLQPSPPFTHSAFLSRAGDKFAFDMQRKQARLEREHHSPHPIWGISRLLGELSRLPRCRREPRLLRRSPCCEDSAGSTWARSQVVMMLGQLLLTLSKPMPPCFSFSPNHFSTNKFYFKSACMLCTCCESHN